MGSVKNVVRIFTDPIKNRLIDRLGDIVYNFKGHNYEVKLYDRFCYYAGAIVECSKCGDFINFQSINCHVNQNNQIDVFDEEIIKRRVLMKFITTRIILMRDIKQCDLYMIESVHKI